MNWLNAAILVVLFRVLLTQKATAPANPCIPTSQGGGLTITTDDAMAKKLHLSVDKCYDRSPGASQRNATFMANNYRMTELQGAVAIANSGVKPVSAVSRVMSRCGLVCPPGWASWRAAAASSRLVIGVPLETL